MNGYPAEMRNMIVFDFVAGRVVWVDDNGDPQDPPAVIEMTSTFPSYIRLPDPPKGTP